MLPRMTVAESAPQSHGYRTPARVLHWLTAVLVLATLPVGQVMVIDGLPRALQNTLFIFHKNVGVVILLLVLARLAYRAARPAPPLPDTLPRWQAIAAKATHWLLYGLLIVMAVSGYIRVEAGDFPIELLDALGIPPLVPVNKALAESAQSVHYFVRLAVFALVALHVLAVLHHELWRRDGVFRRMWPPVVRSGR